MNKVFRILMNKSVRRVLNPKKVTGVILTTKLLMLINKYI